MAEPGTPSFNAHRLVRFRDHRGKPSGWGCTAPGCTWTPVHDKTPARDQFRKHLYELAPKGQR